jgi:hypothetical protein
VDGVSSICMDQWGVDAYAQLPYTPPSIQLLYARPHLRGRARQCHQEAQPPWKLEQPRGMLVFPCMPTRCSTHGHGSD